MRIYREILKQAWHILWSHPWLWLFGLLAAVAGNGGEYNSLLAAADRISNQANFLGVLKSFVAAGGMGQTWAAVADGFARAPLMFVWGIFLLAVVTLLIVWLVVVAQAALIKAAGTIDGNEPISLTQAATGGVKYFWPILWLNIVAKFFTYLLLAVAFLPFLISFLARPEVASWSFDSLILISFLVSVPLWLIVSFVLKYAAIYVVLEKQTWWHALERALNLFFRNWLVSLEMAGLLFLVNIVISLIVYIFIPTDFGLQLSLLGSNWNTLALIRVLQPALITVAAASWYATFSYLTWTILFRRLTAGPLVPKLVRLATDIPNYLDRWMTPTTSVPPSKPNSAKR